MSGMLIASGATSSAALAGDLVWRATTYVLPIFTGIVTCLFWKRGLPKGTHEKDVDARPPTAPSASEGEASGADRTRAGQSLILARCSACPAGSTRARTCPRGSHCLPPRVVSSRPQASAAVAVGGWSLTVSPSQEGPARCRLPRPAGRVRGLTADGWARARPAAVTTATAVRAGR